MKTLYLDCSMGAAGDMLMAALLEICPDKGAFLEKMNNLGLPGVRVLAEPAEKCGIMGTRMEITVHGEEEESLDADDSCEEEVCGHVHSRGGESGCAHSHGGEVHSHVYGCGEEGHSHGHGDEDHGHIHSHGEEDHVHGHGEEDHSHVHCHGEEDHGHHHHHHHADMAGITDIISRLNVPEEVRKDMEHVYRLIAEAEAHAHGKPVEQIHFHEVGTLDAVADVAGVCLLMNELDPDQVFASPVHVGSGHVRCAHGILPVPAPATAHILQGIPIYSTSVKGELCTPTGAALLKYFVKEFGEMPVMAVRGIGYGMGKKDFERANCVRAFLGETAEKGNEVVELSCNLDDMTAEDLGFIQELLFEKGALEVYTVPAGMKKNRPGVLLSCMCRKEDEETMAGLIFRHTTTLGIREHISRRFTLNRKLEKIETEFGPVRVKKSWGYGAERRKFEYEDLAGIARERGISLEEVRDAARRAEEEQ